MPSQNSDDTILFPAAGGASEHRGPCPRPYSLSSAARPALGCLALLLLFVAAAFGQENDLPSKPAIGPGKVIVHSKFGGQIYGFDIDQNGTEGVLSEGLFQSNGNVLAAVETFSQSTGKILKVVSETQTQ